jgi:hypothetical protein
MTKSNSLTAEQIAESQLHAALRMWRERDFVSCITLAGAAEEILGKRLRRLGQEPSFDNMKAAVVKIAEKLGETDPNIDRDIAQLMNQTKNELKHYAGDDHLEFDLRADAEEMLERAIANYTMLTNNTLPEMLHFWADVDEA